MFGADENYNTSTISLLSANISGLTQKHKQTNEQWTINIATWDYNEAT